MRLSFVLPITLAVASAGASLQAAVIHDDPNDFLGTFTTGPKNGDLDVITAEVKFDGTNFTFTNTENGPIGQTEGSVFVWGVDRGLHQQFFGSFAPGVLFDVAVIFFPDASGLVVDFSPSNPDAAIALPAGSVTIDGNTITGVVPASFLPTRGLQPGDYQVNFWPRVGLDPSNNAQISDFAPNDHDEAVTTPEPGAAVFLGAGLLMVLAGQRRRRS